MFVVSRGHPCHATRNRRGTATVELAVCLPMLVIIALGSIEATNAIFLKDRLTSAAYEAHARQPPRDRPPRGATTAATNILTQFNISGGQVTITPAVTASTATGTQVTVSVSAPFSSNSWMQPFIIGKTLTNVTATVVMDHQ